MNVSVHCPYCGKMLAYYSGLFGASTIGPPVQICGHCGGTIKTRQSEWVEKEAHQKTVYWTRVGLWILCRELYFCTVLPFFAIIAIADYFFGVEPGEMARPAILLVVALTACNLVISSLLAFQEIRRSIKRSGAETSGNSNQ